MSQAMYTAKTGITTGQTQIDVVANNVANINTTAYKTANATFSTLFSKTLSAGSMAATNGGGTNPRQIGFGAQVASISRDFNTGSFMATNVNSDLMISGRGYFVVEGSDGGQLLTRDGHFSLDSAGNLTTAAGMRVFGSTKEYSTISSGAFIKVPPVLNASVDGTSAVDIAKKTMSDLNAVSVNNGKFSFSIGSSSRNVPSTNFAADGAGGYNYTEGGVTKNYARLDVSTLPSDERTVLKDLYGTINPTDEFYKNGTGINATYVKGPIPLVGVTTIKNPQKTLSYEITDADQVKTLEDFVTDVNTEFKQQLISYYGVGTTKSVEFGVVNGGLKLNNNSGESFGVASGTGDQTTDFIRESGIFDSIESAPVGSTEFHTKDMNLSAIINDKFNNVDSLKRTDWTISDKGILSAQYDDGSILTIQREGDGSTSWKYTTAENVEIVSSGLPGTDLDMSGTSLEPSNLAIQMCSVVNEGGLIAEIDNCWSMGPNTGEFAFGLAGTNGFGGLKTGGLEGSNVDMTTELSNMIVAQRAIQMNSRVFSTASTILESLSYLGQ